MDETDAHRHRPSDWTAMDRVRHDIASGRLWKARDRLYGMLSWWGQGQGSPVNKPLEVLDLLGDVHFRMGDLPQAGRCWYQTERQDEDTERAIDAWRARHGDNPRAMMESLQSVSVTRKLGPIARARMDELTTRVPDHARWPRYADDDAEYENPTSTDWLIGGAIVGGSVLGTVGIWVVGVVAIVRWLL